MKLTTGNSGNTYFSNSNSNPMLRSIVDLTVLLHIDDGEAGIGELLDKLKTFSRVDDLRSEERVQIPDSERFNWNVACDIDANMSENLVIGAIDVNGANVNNLTFHGNVSLGSVIDSSQMKTMNITVTGNLTLTG